MIELTDAELEQVHGGVSTGVGTAYLAQGGTLPRDRDPTTIVVPADHADAGFLHSIPQSGIVPTGHGTITAHVVQSR